MNQINEYNETIFERIKHTNEYGKEYWYARELQVALYYKEWRKFSGVIEKAKTACDNSDINTHDHFVGVDKMVDIGSRTQRKQDDYNLSRYACYLTFCSKKSLTFKVGDELRLLMLGEY